jgi:uncharacterized protein YndB with AHSA1/START domain
MNNKNKQQGTGEPPSLKIVRKFDVVPEVVFDAFTKPEAMRVWWTDDTTFDIDLRVDGRWTITRKEGDTIFEMTGEYLEINRPHRLIFEHELAPNNSDPQCLRETLRICQAG